MTELVEGVKRAAELVVEGEPKKAKIESSVARRPKPHKFAILMSYNGANYFGMQINADCNTIEGELFEAMNKVGLLTDDQAASAPSSFGFQRAARTDKRVSAIKQMCSIHLSVDPSLYASPLSQRIGAPLLGRLNDALPDDIRVMGMKRATKGFSAKNACDSRSYSYTLPTFAFAHVTEMTDHNYRMSEERLAELNRLLEIFVGTHNFFNYTSGKQHHEASCNRFIMSCACGKPFEQSGWEMAIVNIKGQSFMLHQIRKIIGMTIAIMRGLCDKTIIQRSWESERLDVPRAPGLGLLLEKVHYEEYDRRYGKTHEALNEWPECEESIEKFRREKIVQKMIEMEIAESSMIEWMSSLAKHNFDGRLDETTRERVGGNTWAADSLKAIKDAQEAKECDKPPPKEENGDVKPTTDVRENDEGEEKVKAAATA